MRSESFRDALRRALCVVAAVSASAAQASPPSPDGPFLDLSRAEFSFVLSEFQPDVRYSGRVNGIAIHPVDEDVVIVGTERGGLFRSRDGGVTWSHLDGFPEWWVLDVAFHPGDPDVVLATTEARHFRGGGSGGIWRSTDGGATWAQPPTSRPSPGPSCRAGAGAYKLAFEPKSGRVFAATDCGIARSSNLGETWRHWPFPGPTAFEPAYRAITALGDGRVVAAGPNGVLRSRNGGRVWTPVSSVVGSVSSYQALARSPYYRDDVYVVNDRFELHMSNDAGRSWSRLGTGSIGGGGGCGGFEFVRVAPKDRRTGRLPFLEAPGLDVYLGNRCALYRSHARRTLFTYFRPVYSDVWTSLDIDHADTRDLAFFGGGRPAFLATDGGFHRTADEGTTWRLSGSGRGGLNALQIYDVAGQQITSPPRHDLYIGTQDNGLFSSDDTGRTWPHSCCSEGWSIFLEPQVERAEDSSVTWGTPYNTWRGGANFRDLVDWPDPQATRFSEPVLVGPRQHVQQTGPTADEPGHPYGLALTESLGELWSELVEDFGTPPAQLPKVSRYGSEPVAYQAYRWGTDATGDAVFKLARVSPVLGGGTSGRLRFPAMNGFGSLGVHNKQFVWSTVFGVDPQDPMHLIAADARNGAMARSIDGGDNWSPLTGLTDLMTGAGARQFTVDRGEVLFSLGTAVGFSPQNPNLALVGAAEGGLYFSGTRGATWRRIPGSEIVPVVTGFHWQAVDTAYVSTFGRGLWKLAILIRLDLPSFEIGCGGPVPAFRCGVLDLEGRPAPWTFDRAVVAFGGGITDATVAQGQLASFATTPGTTTILFSDRKGDAIKPPEDRATPGAFEGVKVAARLLSQGLVVRGLTFTQGRLSGVVVSEAESPLQGPGSFLEFKDAGEPTPGNEDEPHLFVAADEVLAGTPVASPSAVLEVAGRGFARNAKRPVELVLDGRRLNGVEVSVRKGGTFRARIRLEPLRLRPGIHSLTATQRLGHRVLRDTSPFGVRHDDDFAEPGRQPK